MLQPPKKAYLNYKLLQENVRLKKEEKVTKLQVITISVTVFIHLHILS